MSKGSHFGLYLLSYSFTYNDTHVVILFEKTYSPDNLRLLNDVEPFIIFVAELLVASIAHTGLSQVILHNVLHFDVMLGLKEGACSDHHNGFARGALKDCSLHLIY